MEVRIRSGKNLQTEAFARFHRVVCDQPFDEGGGDTGMTPPELMLSALGCCAMHYAAMYLRTRDVPHDKLEIKISGEKGGRPARLIDITLEVHTPALNPRQREGLLKAVEVCLLHQTLADPPRVKVSLVEPMPAAMAS